MDESSLPETIEQAVRLLKSLIAKDEQDKIAAMPAATAKLADEARATANGYQRQNRGTNRGTNSLFNW